MLKRLHVLAMGKLTVPVPCYFNVKKIETEIKDRVEGLSLAAGDGACFLTDWEGLSWGLARDGHGGYSRGGFH